MFGFTMQVTAEQAAPIRALDPFFLQGTASANHVSMYTSLLQAPQPTQYVKSNFVYQVSVSGLTDKEPFRRRPTRTTNDERIAITQTTLNFAEPLRLFVSLIPDDTSVKQLDLEDWTFPEDHTAAIRSLHTCIRGLISHLVRGAGANHAIGDVLELRNTVFSRLGSTAPKLRSDVDKYQRSMASRTLPSVLASRQACLEAHDWSYLTSKSHLLSVRQMVVDFDDCRVTSDQT
ncbi:uncharacterized protein M421DRAFT_91547 [Didymella exigua CBS 183.55]|uniref:Uncharacterized protein n=1 Tax=Didymella exigua CBS 183.55 TaxID=1150837 RepID=A0A6A5RRP8_9PLEO|nr:uncharacterized protein M421DRAFT_91547 [Didymella exigua CBS 183.55]KAF1929734.1 hypothetical protein M421DRAFT_91547 [Didymella exigua CBS 183.55]